MAKACTKTKTVPRSLFNVVLLAFFIMSGLAIYALFFRQAGMSASGNGERGRAANDTLVAFTNRTTTVVSENNSNAEKPAVAASESQTPAFGKVAKKRAAKKAIAPLKTESTSTVSIPVALPKENGQKEPGKTRGETDDFDYFARYKVRGRAHIHTEPEASTKRAAFITHWNNAILKPLDEQNSFIYIIFTNHEGVTSRGWLSKADLIKVR